MNYVQCNQKENIKLWARQFCVNYKACTKYTYKGLMHLPLLLWPLKVHSKVLSSVYKTDFMYLIRFDINIFVRLNEFQKIRKEIKMKINRGQQNLNFNFNNLVRLQIVRVQLCVSLLILNPSLYSICIQSAWVSAFCQKCWIVYSVMFILASASTNKWRLHYYLLLTCRLCCVRSTLKNIRSLWVKRKVFIADIEQTDNIKISLKHR